MNSLMHGQSFANCVPSLFKARDALQLIGSIQHLLDLLCCFRPSVLSNLARAVSNVLQLPVRAQASGKPGVPRMKGKGLA